MHNTLTRLTGIISIIFCLILLSDSQLMASDPPVKKNRQLVQIDFVTTNVSCFGGNDGTARAIAFDGALPFTYLWSNGAETETIINLTAGTYSVTVTDDNGAAASGSVIITEPEEMIPTLVLSDTVLTCNDSTIAASVGMDGGTPPFTYIWTFPFGYQESGQAIQITAPGFYSYEVTDSKGCQVSGDFLIYSDNIPVIQMTLLDSVSCNGLSDGAAFATITGGATPYELLWSNGATTDTIQNLVSGAYTLTVTDAEGCHGQATIFIPQAGDLAVELMGTNITCFGQETGVITSTVVEGVAPYEYLWSNLSTNPNLINVPAGQYTLSVTDSDGCLATASIVLTQGPQINIFTSVEHVSCFAFNDGLATAVALGGSGALSYVWSNGVNGQIISNLVAGSYTVFVSDTNNCVASSTVEVTQPDLLTLILNSTPEHLGNDDGTATVEPTGGTSPYSYDWSNGGTTQTITGLTTGVYYVTVTDINGCSNWDSVYVGENNCAFDAILTLHHVSCFGGADGLIIPEITVPGSEPYYFLWSDGSSGVFLNNLEAGSYSVTITDNANCMVFLSGTIAEPSPLNIDYHITQPTDIFDPTGSITFTIFGGQAPYTVEINGQSATGLDVITIDDLPPGDYIAVITDARNCTHEIDFTITNVDCVIGATISEISRPICFGGNEGEICVNFSGNFGDVEIEWSNGSSNECISGLISGIYNVAVRDTAGCTATAEFVMTQPAQIVMDVVDFYVGTGNNDGQIKLFVSGGVPPFNYSWTRDGLAFATTRDITGLNHGTYILTVIDSRGCVITFEPLVIEPISNKKVSTERLSIIPNPAQSVIVINLPEAIEKEALIEFSDMSGRVITSIKRTHLNVDRSVDVSKVPTGTYVIRVLSGKDLFIGRFIKVE